MKQTLKEIRGKGTNRKDSALLNITHMHAFVRNVKRENQTTMEAEDDCYLCIGTRMVIHGP